MNDKHKARAKTREAVQVRGKVKQRRKLQKVEM
jgi:hypothetical protein